MRAFNPRCLAAVWRHARATAGPLGLCAASAVRTAHSAAELQAGNKAAAKGRAPVLPESAWSRTLIAGPARAGKAVLRCDAVGGCAKAGAADASPTRGRPQHHPHSQHSTTRGYPPVVPLPDAILYDQPAIPNPAHTAEAHQKFRRQAVVVGQAVLLVVLLGGAAYVFGKGLYLDSPQLLQSGAGAENVILNRLSESKELLSPEELEKQIAIEERKHKARQGKEAHELSKASYVLLTIKRSSTIAKAVVVSMLDYRRTLGAKYDNEEQQKQALSQCHTRSAQRVLHALQANGGIYIKLGQHVSATLFIPQEWRDVLTPLQDQNKPTALKELELMFQAETSKTFDQAFSFIDPNPIGVASLAQVHRAIERDTGREVAIKMMHPDVERFSTIDIETVNRLTALVKKTFPQFEFTWLAEEMNENLPLEMNFQHEAGNASHAQRDFQQYKKTTVYIPQVYYATKRVMIMEFIHGRRPDDLEYLKTHNINRNQVSQELSKAFAQMLYMHGFFHADPHAGNVLIRAIEPNTELAFHSRSPRNFEVVLLDHGLYFHLPQSLRADYARFWLSLLSHGTPQVQQQRKQLAQRVGNIGDDLYPILESAITGRSGLEGSDPNNPYGVGGKKRPGSLLDLDGGTKMTTAEANHIQKTVLEREGLFQDVLRMLRVMPRQMLMVLKLNDLTRSLDQNLHTTHGPVRPFLISARYCAMCVWDDDWSHLQRERKEVGWSIGWTKKLIGAWYNYTYFNYGFRVIESFSDLRARVSIMSLYLRTVFLYGFATASRAAAGIEEEEESIQAQETQVEIQDATLLLEPEKENFKS